MTALPTTNVTVEDYITASPTMSPVKATKLREVETILNEMGFTWLSLPRESWLEIYKKLGSISPQRISLYDAAIRSFYDWLVQEERIQRTQSRYQKVDVSKVYESGIKSMYFGSLSELSDAVEKSQEGVVRITKQGKEMNQILLFFLWVGLTEQEMLSMKANDLAVDISIRTDLPVYKLTTERASYLLTTSKPLKLLLGFQAEALDAQAKGLCSRPAPMFYAPGASADLNSPVVLSEGALIMRVKRAIEALNEETGKRCTASTIQQSGAYSRAYEYFKATGRDFFYTKESAVELLKRIGMRSDIKPAALKLEFQKFIEYVRAFKGEDI